LATPTQILLRRSSDSFGRLGEREELGKKQNREDGFENISKGNLATMEL